MRLKRDEHAASLIQEGTALLTHCNVSGEMVLIGRACREAGKDIRFYATETRPYFQGRLTSWELSEDGLSRGLFDLLNDYDARLLYNITQEEIAWLKSIRFRAHQRPTSDTYIELLKTYRKLSNQQDRT